MFQLTCPKCQSRVQTPFVRLGAVATCRQCATRYRVEASHVEKLGVKPTAEVDPLLSKPVASVEPTTAAATDPAAELARAVVGAQGPPTPTASPSAAQVIARRARTKRSRSSLVVMVVVTIVIAVAVVIGAWYGFTHQLHQPTVPHEPTPSKPAGREAVQESTVTPGVEPSLPPEPRRLLAPVPAETPTTGKTTDDLRRWGPTDPEE